MDERVTRQVWVRLLTASPLDDLGLPRTSDGKLDLRGLVAPQPEVLRELGSYGGISVSQLSRQVILRGVEWRDLDFSGSTLDSVLFFDGRIEGCRFDKARCRRFRVWGTHVAQTSFREADLREAVLSGLSEQGARNRFDEVDFSKADLRGSVHVSGDFIGCEFSNAKLDKVDFGGDVFDACRFAGVLNEVLFYRHHVMHESLPPNTMRDVDFRRAKLRVVAFRGLDLETVKWPEDDEHIVVEDYPAVCDRFLRVVSARTDPGSKALTGLFTNYRQWVGPNQKRGVINKHDLVRFGGVGAVESFLHATGLRP